jgi:hypothetical protein
MFNAERGFRCALNMQSGCGFGSGVISFLKGARDRFDFSTALDATCRIGA